MNRRIETAIAWFTLGALVAYVPGETYVSWPELWDPFYLIDLIAMILLLWGSVHSLRARPHPAPGLLAAAYGWAASNGWQATFWRIHELQTGGDLDYGVGEGWVIGIATGIALALFAIVLALTASNGRRRLPDRI